MPVTVGTFNLNNLFSRFNFQAEIDQDAGGDGQALQATYTFSDPTDQLGSGAVVYSAARGGGGVAPGFGPAAPERLQGTSRTSIIGEHSRRIGVLDMSIYTLGIWTVKPGREDEFIQAWRDLGTRTKQEFPGATAVLLRDREDPRRFISTGPWESLERIETWRGSATFKDGVGRIRELLDGFEPHTMDEAAVIG